MNNPFQTVRQVLPYRINADLFGKRVWIENTKGEIMTLTRDDITAMLSRDDLDPHRRKMYEAARDALREARQA